MMAWLEDRWWTIRFWLRHPIDCFYDTRLGQWWCERHGHAGVIWFNPGGTEPDMRCKRCGRDCG